MFSLPPSTLINKPLFKKAVFEKFNLKAPERERFDADISRMVLLAHVSPSTISALKEGNEIKDFYVMLVALKHKDYDTRNILMLQKLIPQKLVFALQYEGETQLCIFHTRLQQSAWSLTDETKIPLNGLTLDSVWENLVAEIGQLDAKAEETIEEQILDRERREKLQRQIEMLEKQCRTEKQTRRKYELHQEISRLKRMIII